MAVYMRGDALRRLPQMQRLRSLRDRLAPEAVFLLRRSWRSEQHMGPRRVISILVAGVVSQLEEVSHV